ncbi:MAG: hypothetical protein K9N55_12080 [Phycisphaerae bacterium]|nr:hypothetical protein [Phycisphaerae bacterium]
MESEYFVYRSVSSGIQEIFITTAGKPDVPVQLQVETFYLTVRDLMAQDNAAVFQERIFGTEAAVKDIQEIRSRLLEDCADPVPPSLLVGSSGICGEYFGIQVHLVAGNVTPEVIKYPEGPAIGRLVKTPHCQYLGLSGITSHANGPASGQARAMFDQANAILKDLGAGFLAVPRTWLWLRNILDWYGDLNAVRNAFFTECGILGGTVRHPMPASTGIGLGPANGRACAMDLTAVLSPDSVIEYHQAGGKQQSAYEYGSAFSRASAVRTPGGRTAFISGTASIDEAGLTTHIGDPKAQIAQTIENVIAVLNDMDFDEDTVVQVMAYCKTKDVQSLFMAMPNKPNWPWISMVCDVCRDDLLFEIEALAIKEA